MSLPFSKKTAPALKQFPLQTAQKQIPPELAKVLKKIRTQAGSDMIADNSHVLQPLRERFARTFKRGSVADAFDHGDDILGSIMSENPTFSAVVPIVLNPSDGKGVELIGSGVLIRIINRTFLL